MSRRPALFRQSDLARTIKTVIGLGLKVAEVKIGRDDVRVVTEDAAILVGDDAELAKFRARHGYE